MWAFRVLCVLTTLSAFVVVPVQLVSTFVLGLLFSLPLFGLLLLPLSLIWIVFFLAPLLGLSWLWQKAPPLRIPLALAGIPLALVGDAFVAMMPCMGEWDSRISKLLLCQIWPFSWECWKFISSKADLSTEEFDRMEPALFCVIDRVPLMQSYVEAIMSRNMSNAETAGITNGN